MLLKDLNPNWYEHRRLAHKHPKHFRRKAMHYRNGREAKNGDVAVRLDDLGHVKVVGVLTNAQPGNDHCNGTLEPFHEATYACLCDCLHVDDLAELLKEKGLDKRPSGK